MKMHIKNTYGAKTIILFLVLLIGATAKTSTAEECFVAAPYVLHATYNSAQVVWVTQANISAGHVIIQDENGQDKTIIADISSRLFQDSDRSELDHLRHLVKLEDLEPYTRYNYEVHCGDGETKSKGSFLTTPVPGESVPFNFVVDSDAHASDAYIPFAEAIGAQNPSFVIHTGDFTSGRGYDWGRWETYFRVARPYLESTVLVPVVGGHDVTPARNFRSLFAFNDPESDPSDEDDAATYYTFEFGNMLVIILDYVYDQEKQIAWVEEVLSSSQSEWIIVAQHVSFANAGGRGRWFDHDVYRQLAQLFEKHGVDLVITGHDHIYERNLPLGPEGVKPVHYISINTRGNFRRVRPSPIVAGGIGQRVHMYTHFRVNGNHLEMEALLVDGTVIDKIELSKDEYGMYQDEVMSQAVDLELATTLAHIYTGQSLEESIRYERRDITGIFYPPLPKAGEDAIVKLNTGYSGNHELDVSRFPIGSELIVYGQDDKSKWRAEKQIIEITGNTAKVHVKAPDGLTHDEEGFNIPLELHLNIRVNGREFEPVVVWPTMLETSEVGKVELKQPENDETVMANPVLIWEDDLHAAEYQLQVGKSSFQEIIVDTVITDDRFEFTNNLKEGATYVWRVRGRNEFEGPWSDEYSFHVFEETEREDIDEVKFSNILMPMYLGLDVPKVSTGSFGSGFRDYNRIYTWLESDEKLILEVSGGRHNDTRGGNVYIALYSKIEEPVKVDFDESVPPDGEWYEVIMESPYSGLHQVILDDGNNRTLVDWPEGHPMTVLASKDYPFDFERNSTLYFYVPEETEFVSGYLGRHYSVSFRDTDGNELAGWQNLEDETGYFSIAVPENQSGGLWRFSTARGNTLSLMTVPPYLARNERELLLPAEVLGIEPTKSENHEDLPDDIELGQNYPNPFNPSTRIVYSVPDQTHVRLAVYNVVGQRVATLVNEQKPAGRHDVIFDASGLSSGIYLYQLRTDTRTMSRQMLLVK